MPNTIMQPILMTVHDGTNYFPAVEEGIKWSTERVGVPGSLTFTVLLDDILQIANGDIVYFKYGDYKIFYGFIFEIKQKADKRADIKAYDQLRYFKNKDFYNYQHKTTAQLIQMIAADYNLNCGELADSGFELSRIEKDKTLFDIVKNSMDATLKNTGELYVFYDDFGHLTLKNIAQRAFNVLIDETTAQDYEYTRSIDKQTYNKVKITYDNSETGSRDVYIAQSGENMNKWGTLVLTESLKKGENGPEKAHALLNLYNEESRNLTIKDAFGDVNIRAGCLLVVKLDFDDIHLSNLMLVEKCKHTWKNEEHWMELTLRGGAFVA